MDESAPRPATPGGFPSRDEFNEEAYLQLHPDIAAVVASGEIVSGWQHFSQHGFAEGRAWVAKPDRMIGVRREVSPMDEMLLGNESHYFDVGESALHCIESALFAARRAKSSIGSILDLPCGHGRVMRFVRKAFPHAEITACDLNADGVEFCARTFGARPLASSERIADIRLDRSFDVIWCGSLLTHLPADRCMEFLSLFQQSLGHGGVLVFTTHGRYYERSFASGKHRSWLSEAQVAALLDGYRETGYGYVDYSGKAGYGFSLAHPSFVTSRMIGSDWRLLGYHESGWDKRQDVICLVKSVPSHPS